MGKRTAYEPYEHFMLRAPLFPVEFLREIPDSPQRLSSWLQEKLEDPLIREGIVLASVEFSRHIGSQLSATDNVPSDPGLQYALLRYLTRFSSRCTPFGTFAGFTTGRTGTTTAGSLGPVTGHHLHARPDMEYLMGIARFLDSDPEVREKLTFFPNSTLYRVGDGWHYVETGLPSGKTQKTYDIVTVEDNRIVSQILGFCECGRTLAGLREFLVAAGWTGSEVSLYVQALVDSQVIVSELEPVVCGPEYIDCLISVLEKVSGHHPAWETLVRMKDLFDRMNRPASVLANFHRVEQVTASLPVAVNPNRLIQVDMKLNGNEMTLDARVTGQVLLGLRIRKALSRRKHTDPMKGFREAFLKRYGERRVMLLKALDPETGIGLEGRVEGYWTDPVPWIDDLRWGPGFQQPPAESDPGNAWLAGKYHEAIRRGLQYITLESADLQTIGIHDGQWPLQMTAMVELFGPDDQAGWNINLLSGSSGNPSYLLGRFGFADPGDTCSWIHQLIEDDQAAEPELLFTEVVHLPEDRNGNVLQRPSFLEHEIPYLARSARPADHRIRVTDLMVAVENQKVVLYSAISGRTIRPVMTNAYNHQLGHLSLYKFLHRIRFQDPEHAFEPDWGSVVRQAPFIPGIRFKNMIVSAPEWLIRCADLAGWIHYDTQEIDMRALTNWRKELRMPDEMLWMSADQELYVDWAHPNLVLAFWDVANKSTWIRLRPFYLSPGTPVKGPDGSHANQFVLCYRKS